MDSSQVEKLKTEIKGSPILSAPERAEWLALLELMNDKQLLELEKILDTGSMNTQLGVVKPSVSIGQPVPNSKPQTPNSSPQMPRLSHIMNLPSNLESKSFGSTIRQDKAPSALQAPVLSKQQNKFGAKLKSMVEEKELAGAKPEGLLASPKANTTEYNIPKSNNNELLLQKKSENQIPESPNPKGLAPVVPKPSINKIQEQSSIPKTPVLETEKKFSDMRKDLTLEVKAILEDKNNSKPSAELAPGLSKLPSLFNIRPENVKLNPETPPTKSKFIEMAKIPNKAVKEPPFNGLQDLAALDVAALNLYDFNSLIKKIKSLAGKFGYHEMLLSLEQSPVYKAYLKTGMEILSSQTNFEQLSDQNLSPYLNRQQFEEMADMLRQVQAG